MKKRVRCTAAFAAAVMAVSLLGGCGQDGVTAPENVEKDKKSQYKWTKYTISNWDFI